MEKATYFVEIRSNIGAGPPNGACIVTGDPGIVTDRVYTRLSTVHGMDRRSLGAQIVVSG
jgi:hypothetical protein